MKVEKVTASIKYSQDTGKGAWKAVEIGAEGSVDAKENWQAAQASLYGQLSQQLKVLWSNGQNLQNDAQGPRSGGFRGRVTRDTSPAVGALLPGPPDRVQTIQPR